MIPDPSTWTAADWAVYDHWAGGPPRCIGRIRTGRRCQTRVAAAGGYCRQHLHQLFAQHDSTTDDAAAGNYLVADLTYPTKPTHLEFR